MSQDQRWNANRREFLGTATAATAVTLTASSASEAPSSAPNSAEEIDIAQTTTDNDVQPTPTNTNDWTKPAAMAIPKEGYFKLEQGRFGPIFPRTPANYGFTIIAKVKPGRAETIRQYGKTIEKSIAADPSLLAPLKLHYLRWVLFDLNNETYFMYQGIFDTEFDKYTEDAIALFNKSGVSTVFENLEGFPVDWRTNVQAFVKFMREHQRPSFLEYGEYPYVSGEEIKRALRVKSALSAMLDQMQ
jgi:hypothetical protein